MGKLMSQCAPAFTSTGCCITHLLNASASPVCGVPGTWVNGSRGVHTVRCALQEVLKRPPRACRAQVSPPEAVLTPAKSAPAQAGGPPGERPGGAAAPMRRSDSDLSLQHSWLVGVRGSHLDMPTLLATSPQ